jgi:glutathione S-transferase
MIPQSQAILRHLARVHGRYGRDEAEMLAADVLAETVHDVRAILAPFANPATRGKDPAGLKQAVEEKLPLGLARLEKLHGHAASGLFIESVPTWADCVAYDLLGTLDEIAPAALGPFPGLRAFLAAMSGHPSLSDYLARRRPSELAVLRQVLETGVAA